MTALGCGGRYGGRTGDRPQAPRGGIESAALPYQIVDAHTRKSVDESAFWAALDSDVDEHGPPAILLTVFWHARSSRDIFNSYEGTTVWAHEPSLEEFSKRAPVTNVFAAGDELPGGVEPLAMHHMHEAAFWLPSHAALLVGDSILGYEDEVRLCPEGWLREGESPEQLQATANRALERRPRWLLLTHGGPRQSSPASL